MQLQLAIKQVFEQINQLLQQLTPQQYQQPSSILFNATIGQHVRHIVELFVELEKGYENGIVNYENRKRDYRIETDKMVAVDLLLQVHNALHKANKPLLLQAAYDAHSDEVLTVATNYYREIAYNLEHTVHHMALIRVGTNDVANIVLPANFGIASATIKYRQACAQ